MIRAVEESAPASALVAGLLQFDKDHLREVAQKQEK